MAQFFPVSRVSALFKPVDGDNGNQVLRVVALDDDGQALVIRDNQLVRAAEIDSFQRLVSHSASEESHAYIAAAPGWKALISTDQDPSPVLRPIAMWHVRGPADIRPVVVNQSNSGLTDAARGDMTIHDIIAPTDR